jgi:ribonuclease P protein subunit POP4
MNLKKFIRGELIGKTIKITYSKNKTLIGISGRVIDETKHTLMLEDKKKRKKRVLKNSITFEARDGREIINIKGELITGRPEDRVKLKVK